MKTLTANDLLSTKLNIIKLEIPEANGIVYITEPTGYERSEYELFVSKYNDDENVMKSLRGYVAVRCLTDEKGNKLFKDEQADEVNKSLSAIILDRVLEAYQVIVLVSDEAISDAAKK